MAAAPSVTSLRLRLLGRGVRHRCLRLTGGGGRPQALSLEVTRRCIAKCVMCNIWRTDRDLPEIGTERWVQILSDPALADLRELDVTGGEPFLRDDLADLLLGVGRLSDERLTRLHSVAITTNGFLTGRVLAAVEPVAADYAGRGLGLVFACAMDGIGEVHDRIRGYRGGWAKLDRTIAGLAALRERHGNLVLGLKMTVSPHNVDQMDAVAAYAEEHEMFTIISPCILTPARYGNLDLEEDLAFSEADIEAMKEFYRGSRFRWSYFARELLRYLDEGKMHKPCTAGFNYAFIRSTGELYPCPLIDFSPGNVLETSVGDLLGAAATARFRKGVGGYPDCVTCTEPGLERYALPYEGLHYLRLSLAVGAEEFRTLHQHLGLAKYFE
jgi:MoaA/NifB/PqqE/SkfB family radical SAM enzyme